MYIHKRLVVESTEDYEGLSDKPSLTIPDEAMSIQELFQAYAQGNLPNIAKQTYYDDEAQDSLDLDYIQDGQAYDHSFRDDYKDSVAAIRDLRISKDKSAKEKRKEEIVEDVISDKEEIEEE